MSSFFFFFPQHIDVLLYYFRKGLYHDSKSYQSACKVTNVDSMFKFNIRGWWSDFEKDPDKFDLSKASVFQDYVLGDVMEFARSWFSVDRVGIPVSVTAKKRWVFAKVDFVERSILFYDSLRTTRNDSVLLAAMKPYSGHDSSSTCKCIILLEQR